MGTMSADRVAVVTGAGRGIGRGIAIRLASDGFIVAAVARTSSELDETVRQIEANGGRAIAIVADLTDEQDVERAFDEAEATGAVRALVNNAGYASVGPTCDYALEEWNRTLAVNLTTAFLCSREAFRRMTRGAAIVSISSGAGKHGKEQWAAYCAAKAGLHGLSRALVEEGKPLGIRVNIVCPGGTRTGMRQALFGVEPEGSILEVEEIADVVSFLLSEAAREVRGAEIDVRKVPH